MHHLHTSVKNYFFYAALGLMLAGILFFVPQTYAQDDEESQAEKINIQAAAGPARNVAAGSSVAFDISGSIVPEGINIEEILWDFGDGIKTTGEQVSHTYKKPGNYLVTLSITSNQGQSQDTTEIRVFERLIILVTDSAAPNDELVLLANQAAKNDVLLLTLHAKTSGPEILVEEELTKLLLDIREDVAKAEYIVTWTAGSVGANILSKFGQNIKQAEGISLTDLAVQNKGILLLSETPFGVLVPTAQSVFDQLQPAYVLLSRPQALELLFTAETVDIAQNEILNSPVEYRLLGTFSERTVKNIGVTNFMSYGINFLVNRGIPINSLILILMLPVIATILAFARQVIGIKAFGLVTPAMTTLAFLVMGLQNGLIVFLAVLLSGTLTRLVLRQLRLLYLPRMALVLTSVSLALLLLLGLGLSTEVAGVLSFSIFPALILVILAEEFIALQFKSGARHAFNITLWTLVLSVACYLIVSWELFRTLVLSYPELILLAIPINILLGKWGGLRFSEYIRFRQIVRYGSPPQ